MRYAKIKLSNSDKYATFDSKDVPFLCQRTPYLSRGYVHISINGRPYRVHRLIMGSPRGKVVDHINGDKLDNRRVNLRICTIRQNVLNQGISKDNKTGYKGVTYYSKWKKYRASITVYGKKICSTGFDSAEEAAREYDRMAKAYFGEYARLNLH